MLRHFYLFRVPWRETSDNFRIGIMNQNYLSSPVKLMCSQAPNISSEKKDTKEQLENFREIPVKFKSNPEEKVSHELNQFSKGQTTYCASEVDKFRIMADAWWDTDGEFKALHSLNKLRVAMVRDGLLQSSLSDSRYSEGPRPLKGLKLLDVGCGGGILCEPLARLGAQVTGLDAAKENIDMAQIHAQKDKKVSENVSYINGTIEDHAETVTHLYDGVIASEVVEHVHSVELFVDSCISVTKPGGSLFFTTLNKTTRSWIGAIALGECLLNIVPRGTHDWNKFVPPNDLKLYLERGGCSVMILHGMLYIPVRNEWFWISDSSVNYALHAIKHPL